MSALARRVDLRCMADTLRSLVARRTIAVLAAVAVVGGAAVVAIVLLERRAESSRAAQVSLAQISAQLTQLELVPLAGGATAGQTNAPLRVRIRGAEALFAQGEGQIRSELARLQATAHPAELARVAAPLDRAMATARRAIAIWVPAHGFTASTSAFLTRQGSTLITALQALDAANKAYGARARTLQTEAVVGAAVVVSLLLAAFAFFFTRSDSARAALHAQSLALRQALLALEQAQRERVRLLERTVTFAEHERMRIAADLHDGPIQRLSAVTLAFDLLANQFERGNHERAHRMVDEIRDSLAAETVALRKLMTELRPPILDERGLGAALRDCADHVLDTGADACHVHVSEDLPKLGPEIETVIFRVVREAVVNVHKHAPGAHVEISLVPDGEELRLAIRDDGPGFDTDVQLPAEHAGNGRFGLIGMRERVESVGGTWTVTSRLGGGTRIQALLPQRLKGDAWAAQPLIAA